MYNISVNMSWFLKTEVLAAPDVNYDVSGLKRRLLPQIIDFTLIYYRVCNFDSDCNDCWSFSCCRCLTGSCFIWLCVIGTSMSNYATSSAINPCYVFFSWFQCILQLFLFFLFIYFRYFVRIMKDVKWMAFNLWRIIDSALMADWGVDFSENH